jgi:hypothetical protein
MRTIYQQIKLISAPIVKHYHNDVLVHDRAICAAMRTGDTAYWAPRECGSYLIRCAAHDDEISLRGLRAVRFRLDYFKACNAQYKDLKWFLLESTDGQRGHVASCDAAFAEGRFQSQIRTIEIMISQAAAEPVQRPPTSRFLTISAMPSTIGA